MSIAKIGRRDLLVALGAGAVAGGGGLAVGVWFGRRRERWAKRVPPRPQAFSPNVFVAIDGDETVTIWVAKSEMGQGVHTALPMIVAEELGADWSRVQVRKPIANPNYGEQATVTSSSVRGSWDLLRRAGASARAMLETAAAGVWGVQPADCAGEAGFVTHRPTGRRLSYGSLAQAAATLDVPSDPSLRDPSTFRLVGTPVPRVDIPAKCEGRAPFALDRRLPNLAVATLARAPRFGAQVEAVDDGAARQVPGVQDVRRTAAGVAVIGDHTWAALKGREALGVTWSGGTHDDLDTAGVRSAIETRVDGPVQYAAQRGDAAAALEGSADRRESVYRLPYLAHAPMEPPTCTAAIEGKRCRIWASTQAPLGLRDRVAARFGFDPADVEVHTTYLGGAFGRRVMHDEAMEAVALARDLGRPIKVVWSREDDVRHDHFRPAMLHRLRATVDGDGRPVAWQHRIVGPSILGRDSQSELDALAVDGAEGLPYAVEHLEVGWVSVDLPLQLGFWRSVGHSHTAFAIESFVDELAHAAGTDPLQYRLSMLGDAPRYRRTLERVAEACDWAGTPAAGIHRGLAVHACFGSVVAQVAEVELRDGLPTLRRVVCAVDCGQVINPDTLRAQVEGGILFGLTAALHGGINVEGGAVVEGNFDDYRLLRMGEEPAIEVHTVPSGDPPGGVGEVGVPPLAPAFANAIHAATGSRYRELPLGDRARSSWS